MDARRSSCRSSRGRARVATCAFRPWWNSAPARLPRSIPVPSAGACSTRRRCSARARARRRAPSRGAPRGPRRGGHPDPLAAARAFQRRPVQEGRRRVAAAVGACLDPLVPRGPHGQRPARLVDTRRRPAESRRSGVDQERRAPRAPRVRFRRGRGAPGALGTRRPLAGPHRADRRLLRRYPVSRRPQVPGLHPEPPRPGEPDRRAAAEGGVRVALRPHAADAMEGDAGARYGAGLARLIGRPEPGRGRPGSMNACRSSDQARRPSATSRCGG